MIQDIYPSRLYNEFHKYEISDNDYLLMFNEEGKILLGKKENEVIFPCKADMCHINDHNSTESNSDKESVVYLFSLDDKRFFLATSDIEIAKKNYSYYTMREVRDVFSGKEVFAVFTAFHLWKWYRDNIYCGKCKGKLVFHDKERALACPDCGNVIYPRINPAVIVGVIKDDSLLITKYRRGYAHSALVAGFTEIGETLEETVIREVMEETGVKIKNIRYYKSQPWGMAQDILVGFYCEAEEDSVIHMDENELKYAEWVKREDIILQPNNLSLTNEMMRMFKENKI
ncbi:NAD+ diphosphatase [Eubacterium ruminantium]|uniref:NAD(+) diphosphatase n=1 Tax=Eubacterium ruminantium TaxID=42322 RepID=A0A1T4K6A8_9FIRM|nr:NAD(+) diphosphatase [Eubacterium ruminantium]SCW27417.1 NAD+ diphosphatase [Eubacterium ruminantium]SDM14966.1 NAD+ diphosphatase [Eubacterium ruminantium]SJZ37867.1 NAD+ diphosphatase [Eubacterium ruminantium]